MNPCDKCGERPGTNSFMDVAWLCDDCLLYIKYMVHLQKCNPHLRFKL